MLVRKTKSILSLMLVLILALGIMASCKKKDKLEELSGVGGTTTSAKNDADNSNPDDSDGLTTDGTDENGSTTDGTGVGTTTTTATGGNGGGNTVQEPKNLYSNGNVELIRDKTFERGLWVGSTKDGTAFDAKDTINLKSSKDLSFPAWTLAQWYSKFDVRTVKPTKSGNNYVLKNKGKTVTVDGNGAFTLEVIGKDEYNQAQHDGGQGWPHLIMAQTFVDLPKLSALDKVTLKVDVKTNYCDSFMTNPDPAKNTALLTMAFVLQDRNPNSTGFGDYYWLQFPLYDNRYKQFGGWESADDGGKEINTGKYMVSPAGKDFYNGEFVVGKTLKIDKDIYSLMKSGFEKAKAKGYLSKTKFEDISIAELSFGWEMMGSYNASATISGVSVVAHHKDNHTVANNVTFSNGFKNANEWAIKEEGSLIKDGVFYELIGENWGSRAILKNKAYKNFTMETEVKFASTDKGTGWAEL